MGLNDRIKYAEMKARHSNLTKPWPKKWWGISLIILGIIFIMYLGLAVFYVINKAQEINSEKAQNYINQQQLAYQEAISGSNLSYTGNNINPQMIIVEFGDFACPFCEKSYQGIRQAVEANKDKVKFVWRDYPIHENSVDLALAARCAGEQGKFWEMHDDLFANQAQLKDTGDTLKAKLMAMAKNLALKTEQFDNCFTSKKYLEQIKTDFQDGEILQVQGTPTWFINGYQLTGALPAEKFQELFSGLQ